MFMFFVNKPASIYPYLVAFFVSLLWSLKIWTWKDDIDPIFSFVINIFSFSIWYYVFLLRYYILGGEELIFCKIPLSRFKGIFDFYLTFYAAFIIGINVLIFRFHDGLFLPFILGWFGGLFFIIFEKVVKAKFISKGFKHNSSIKDMKIDDIYQEFREVATKKLIESEENY